MGLVGRPFIKIARHCRHATGFFSQSYGVHRIAAEMQSMALLTTKLSNNVLFGRILERASISEASLRNSEADLKIFETSLGMKTPASKDVKLSHHRIKL